ncbi:MAG: hypothetical protein ACK4N5_10385, partial [Myxococcales bacterium]
MGNFLRYKKGREAAANAGKPLGEGLVVEDRPGPVTGTASLDGVRVEKPAEQGGVPGLRVQFTAHLHQLGGARLVLETTLHEQGVGPLKGSGAGVTDSLGNLSI